MRARVAPPDTTLPTLVLEQLAARDTLIRSLDSTVALQDSTLTLYRAMLASRDTIIGRLTSERESYRGLAEDFRRRAERPSTALTDIAGGVLLGYGAATENETVAGAGVAVIGVPRLLGGLARLFAR